MPTGGLRGGGEDRMKPSPLSVKSGSVLLRVCAETAEGMAPHASFSGLPRGRPCPAGLPISRRAGGRRSNPPAAIRGQGALFSGKPSSLAIRNAPTAFGHRRIYIFRMRGWIDVCGEGCIGGFQAGLRPGGPIRKGRLPWMMWTPDERAGLRLHEVHAFPLSATSKCPWQDRTAADRRPVHCPKTTSYPIGWCSATL